MAYNPGVSDISGQLRAQGMTRGMNSLLEGFDVGIKTYQQNKHIADTSIAKFGAAVANSDALKALLTDENERSKLPSDVVKAYIKLQKEGSLGVREASLLGGFADSYTKTEEDRQQREFRAAQMAQMKQQSAIAQQASSIAQAQNAREQMAADQAQGLYNRNLEASKNMQATLRNAAAMNAGTVPITGDQTMGTGPASFGLSNTIPRPLQAAAAVRSENPFLSASTEQTSQVPNSPLRSGITTPTPNVNVLEDYRNKLKDINVPEAGTEAGNMGGAGVLTVQEADRIRSNAEELIDSGFGPLIKAGVPLSPQNYVELNRASSTAASAANRATAAAASKEAENEFNARKIEIANARLELAKDRADNKLDPFIKNLDDLLALRRISPEKHSELVDQWLTSKADARSDQEKLLGGLKDFFKPDASDPKTKTATPPPKSRVLAPKGSVYMVDANGKIGLVLEKNVKKAMEMGGTLL